MKTIQTVAASAATHAPFQIHFIWTALALAIFAGFAIGAHLSFVIGFDFSLGQGFYSFIQAHGHTQLVGWAGLFIMGVSLHFLPRFAGVPVTEPKWLRRIVGLMATGILLRSVGQSVIPYMTARPVFTPLVWIVALSGVFEWLGVLVYAGLLLRTFRGVDRERKHEAISAVAPYFGMMLAGWLIYASINLVVLLIMAQRREVVVDPAWNEFAISAFIGLVLLPVAFAFSVRTFPLYLRLPAPAWPVKVFGFAYLLGFCLQIVPSLPPLMKSTPQWLPFISKAGEIVKNGVILLFVWKLDLLTRRELPWTVNRVFEPGPERRPTRPGLPDYGEFGRFEWLVYSAYVWLVLAAVLDLVAVLATLLGFAMLHNNDAARHMLLAGFITLLILGMAPRMIPGFMGRRSVASPRLVEATFWLGNTAVLFRVLPLLLPATLFEALPGLRDLVQAAFALSGILGMLAVAFLAVNVGRTVKH